VPPPQAGGSPPDAASARVVYIRSTVGHMPLVTAGVALPMMLRALSNAPLSGDALPLGLSPRWPETTDDDTLASLDLDALP